jgi:Predicted transcriptional regulator
MRGAGAVAEADRQESRSALAGAIANDTRYEMLRFIDDAAVPVLVSALCERFGLHHTTVRGHLAKLEAVGLVQRMAEAPQRAGRPRLLYRTTPRSATVLGEPDAYERLAVLLTEVVRSGSTAREIGRRAGESAAHDAAPRAGGVAALEREMTHQGFSASRRERSGGADLVLRACPYARAAAADPHTICELHLGWVEGFTELMTDVAVTGLITEDPYRAGCVVELRRVDAEPRDPQRHGTT